MIDQILENFRDQIEAITPDDLPDVPFERYAGEIEKASRTPGSDRRFQVLPEDSIIILDPPSPSTRARFQKTILVSILYRVGSDLTTFVERAHKDVDRLCYTLRRPSTYGNGTGWALLGRQPQGRFLTELDDQAKSALVTVAFDVIYSVDYA